MAYAISDECISCRIMRHSERIEACSLKLLNPAELDLFICGCAEKTAVMMYPRAPEQYLSSVYQESRL